MITINTIILSSFGVILFYLVYKSLIPVKSFIPQKPQFLWGESTGKEKLIQSKTGDASLFIESKRRRTIRDVGRENTRKIKESRTQFGSTSGALETYFISVVCTCQCNNPDVIFDGGAATDEFCPVHGDVYDAGNANTTVCGV